MRERDSEVPDCQQLVLPHVHAALLTRHNALVEAIHTAMGRTADCDKKKHTDEQLIADVAYLKRLASDYFKTSIDCGNRALAAEQKYDALVEAVRPVVEEWLHVRPQNLDNWGCELVLSTAQLDALAALVGEELMNFPIIDVFDHPHYGDSVRYENYVELQEVAENLEARHNELREAVEWERECSDASEAIYDDDGATYDGEVEFENILSAASAEVDRLIAEGSDMIKLKEENMNG